MKIGFDAKRAFHNSVGLGNYSRTLLESLWTYHSVNDYVLYTPTPFKKVGLEWEEKIQNSKASIQLKTPTIFKGNFLGSLWRSSLLGRVVGPDHLDLYHGLSHELPPLLPPKIKKVVTIHDLIFLKHPEFFPWIDRMVYKSKFTNSVKNADIVVAISEQTKEDLCELLACDERKIRVVYQSCDPHFFTEDVSKNLKSLPFSYVLAVGSLAPRKNLLNLLRAISQLPSEYQDLHLVCVGDGPEEKKLLNLAHELQFQNRLHLLKGVSKDELKLLYQKAQLLAYPSYYEGFGIPLIESLFSKTPVVTTDGSCFREAAGPGALYINPHSPEDLSANIKLILSDTQTRTQLVTDGYRHVQRFHWKETAQCLINVYGELC